MKKFLLKIINVWGGVIIILYMNKLTAQCNVTLSATPASCSTCCDACITPSVSVSTNCSPYVTYWEPSNPLPCNACAGTTYIIHLTDVCGCKSSDTITITSTTGIHSTEKENTISVFPNPTEDILIIKNTSNNKNIAIVITDISGKEIYRTKNIGELTTINTSQFPKGVYFVSIIEKENILFSKKLMKTY